jgi:putative copper export protein
MVVLTLETWLHFFHLLGSMIWVGGSLILSLIAGRVRQRQDPREIREFATTLSFLGLRVLAPAVIALFVAGVWLVLARGGDFSPLWVLIGLGAFAVAFLIGGIYLSRIAIQMARAEDGSTAADLLGRWILGVRVILVVLLIAVLDMVFKPGL